MPTVPMSHPAIALKNPDGTWSVRIQHTAEGSVTMADFSNAFYAEILAKGYADVINGKSALEARLEKLTTDLAPAVADVKEDASAALADAKAQAAELIATAKTEAGKIKADAIVLGKSAEAEAETLKTQAGNFLAAAKVEAEKLLGEARAEASKIYKKAETPVQAEKRSGDHAPTVVEAIKPPKPPVVEEE